MNTFCFILIMNFFIGLYIFSSVRDHLLISLLSLEFMVLMVFLLFVFYLGEYNFFYTLIYLIVTACEGALGLSILIIMGRSFGGDFMKSLGSMF